MVANSLRFTSCPIGSRSYETSAASPHTLRAQERREAASTRCASTGRAGAPDEAVHVRAVAAGAGLVRVQPEAQQRCGGTREGRQAAHDDTSTRDGMYCGRTVAAQRRHVRSRNSARLHEHQVAERRRAILAHRPALLQHAARRVSQRRARSMQPRSMHPRVHVP